MEARPINCWINNRIAIASEFSSYGLISCQQLGTAPMVLPCLTALMSKSWVVCHLLHLMG